MDDNNALADLSAAWDKSEEPVEEPTKQPVEETPEEEPDAELPDIQPEEPEEPAPAAAEATDNDEPDGEPVQAEGEADKPGTDENVEDERPPVSLPAAAREEWGKVPRAVKDAVLKREKDFAVGIQRYAEGAKRAQAMDKALAPFAQYFAMNQQQPAQGVQQVLATASQLQMGSPQQRAQAVAKMINDFGVDVPTLDSLLTNSPSAPQAEQGVDPRIQAQIDAAIAPFRQREQQMMQAQQEAQRRQQAEVGQTVAQFSQDPKHEFYRDVRGDMADILDLAANRGVQMSMEQAYEKACLLNPDINKVVQSRATQKQLSAKRKAASSVKGNPGGTGEVLSSGSIIDDISAAWDAAGQF